LLRCFISLFNDIPISIASKYISTIKIQYKESGAELA